MTNLTRARRRQPAANDSGATPSLTSQASAENPRPCGAKIAALCKSLGYSLAVTLAALSLLAGCGQEAPAPKPDPAAEAKPTEPAIPDEIQAAAQSLLGTETQVLLFGDLAKNGQQEFLAANVVPKTPKNNFPGTVVTRAVVAENQAGQWSEILRVDEHLKNAKGYLGLTPLSPVTGWRIQYEQDPEKGLQLYFTPIKGTGDAHVVPIGIRWNPAAKRYQSLDRTYEHFLVEAPSLGETARSRLR
jgi:hypothetical protein